jgi:hypothetical protein
MADWATVSSLATAGGTLVLAVATFASVRSANRAARVAERTLLIQLRPLLMPSRLEDPTEKVIWVDGHWAHLPGAHALVDVTDNACYLAMSLRNVGTGIGVLHGWYAYPQRMLADQPHADPGEFRRQTRDLYVPAGGVGFWQGALRDNDAVVHADLLDTARRREPFSVDLLYGDHEGGQRMISRFILSPIRDGGWLCAVGRHWNLDRRDPR